MKKILSFAILALLAGGMTGCKEYLDEKPRGVDVPTKLVHYEGLLFGTPKAMLTVYYDGTFEHTIDADGFNYMFSMEGYPESQAYKWEADIFRAEDNSDEWNNPCTQLYTLNLVVNEVMDAEGGTTEEKEAVRAEARVMRAYYTYMMVQFFGKPYNSATAATTLSVPIITTATTAGESFPQRTIEDVYEYIIKEMTESLPYLPERAAHPNRVFYAAGNAMLGKVYWMMGRYGDAIPYLEAAKRALDADSGRGLVNYADYYMPYLGIMGIPNNDQSPETVFAITTMVNLWTALGPSMEMVLRTLRQDVMAAYFTPGDYRLGLFSGVTSGMPAYDMWDPTDRYYTSMFGSMTANEGITVPDVYLMYAECLARENRTTDAVDVLEELRAARMDDPSLVTVPVSAKDDVVKFAVAERIRENFGTGINWYDMRRLWNDPLFQDMKQFYTRTDGTDEHTLTEARLTMRIPPNIMVWHPEYVQND
jgi:hypothetical protein